MATSTPRLALRKPSGSDLINVLTDLDNNFDIIDNAALITLAQTWALKQTFTLGLDSSGPLRVLDGDSRFGAGALGAAAPFLRLGSEGDTANAYVLSDGTTITDVGLVYRSKGAGAHRLQTGAGNDLLSVTTKGHLLTKNGASNPPTVTFLNTNFFAAAVTGSDACGSYALKGNSSPVAISADTVLFTVTFANTFANVPVVVLGMQHSQPGGTIANFLPSNVTTAGFDVVCQNAWTPASNGNYPVGWIVLGFL